MCVVAGVVAVVGNALILAVDAVAVVLVFVAAVLVVAPASALLLLLLLLLASLLLVSLLSCLKLLSVLCHCWLWCRFCCVLANSYGFVSCVCDCCCRQSRFVKIFGVDCCIFGFIVKIILRLVVFVVFGVVVVVVVEIVSFCY